MPAMNFIMSSAMSSLRRMPVPVPLASSMSADLPIVARCADQKMIAEVGASDLDGHVAHPADDVVRITSRTLDADHFDGKLRVARLQHQMITGQRDRTDGAAPVDPHGVEVRLKPPVRLQRVVVTVNQDDGAHPCAWDHRA